LETDAQPKTQKNSLKINLMHSKEVNISFHYTKKVIYPDQQNNSKYSTVFIFGIQFLHCYISHMFSNV